MSDLFIAAMLYQKLGFHILPVYSVKDGLCSCNRKDCTAPGKHPVLANGVLGASNDLKQVQKWWKEEYIDSNIGIRTGKISNICVLDVDPRNGGDEGLCNLRREFGDFPTTVECSTGGGGKHFYFEYHGELTKSRSHFLKGLDFKSDNGYVVAPPSRHFSGSYYLWEDFLNPETMCLAQIPDWLLGKITGSKSNHSNANETSIFEGNRNVYLTSIAGAMRRKGVGQKAIYSALREENIEKCIPSLPERELSAIAKSVSKYKPSEDLENLTIGEKALAGPIGDIVKKIYPHTESSKEALLLQLIVVLGNLYGRNCFYQVESTKLFPNLFCTIVGKSSWARKGTSWNHIERLIGPLTDENWNKNGLRSGLSSGEGLLFHLRDRESSVGQDKRMTIIESEFSSVLKKISREGNVISQVIRDAWDSKNLSILTKADPIQVTSPHISIIGHITEQELNKFLDGLEIFNGFANRFLWIYSARSKLLPFGGEIEKVSFEKEITLLMKGVNLKERVSLDDNAKLLWQDIYYKLSEERDNEVIDNIVSRGPAQILKLSLIYALASNRINIIKDDLLSALAIWEFSEKTVQKIFGTKNHNPMVEKILCELTENRAEISRTDIRNLFNRNAKKEDIEEAKRVLINKGLITIRKREAREFWELAQMTEDLGNDLRH